MAKDDKQPEMGTPPSPEMPLQSEPTPATFDAKADKAYEQRRAGLAPPDSRLDRIVLAMREHRARAVTNARAAAAAARAAR